VAINLQHFQGALCSQIQYLTPNALHTCGSKLFDLNLAASISSLAIQKSTRTVLRHAKHPRFRIAQMHPHLKPTHCSQACILHRVIDIRTRSQDAARTSLGYRQHRSRVYRGFGHPSTSVQGTAPILPPPHREVKPSPRDGFSPSNR
jgi:hypothetical protein